MEARGAAMRSGLTSSSPPLLARGQVWFTLLENSAFPLLCLGYRVKKKKSQNQTEPLPILPEIIFKNSHPVF